MTSQILTIGESLTDIVVSASGARHELPGGSPMNVAVALGRLGHRSTLLTRIGEDERGRAIAQHLLESGVELTTGSITTEVTSSALAAITAEGDSEYDFDLHWDPVDTGAPEQVDAVVTGSIAAILAPGARLVADQLDARREDSLIVYDPNARPSLMGDHASARAAVESMISRADVVKASHEDVAWLYGLDVHEPHADERLERIVESWLGIGPVLAVMTRASAGSVAFHCHGRVEIDPFPAEVVDTVGAGDTVTAGIVDALDESGLLGAHGRTLIPELRVSEIAQILEHAARLAAITVSRPGANPPWASEIR